MKVSEQIDAFYILKTDPVDYLVIPRLIACCVMLPTLTVMSIITGMLGGILIATSLFSMPARLFIDSARNFLDFWDLCSAPIKGVCFGAYWLRLSDVVGFDDQCGGAKGRRTIYYHRRCYLLTTSDFYLDFFLSGLMFQGVELRYQKDYDSFIFLDQLSSISTTPN